MAFESGDEPRVPREEPSLFDDLEPPRLQLRGDRPTLLARPLAEQPAGAVKRAAGPFLPLQTPAAVAPPADETPAAKASWSQRLILFAVALLIILIDQASKLFIEGWLAVGEQYEIIPGLAPFFQFTRTINRGAAFGMFQNGGLIFAAVAIVVSIVILIYNHQLPAGQTWLRLALGLQMGGAMGNMIDRLRQGFVTDFMDINVESLIDIPYANWPIFNVADMSIVGGVILLIIIMLFLDEDPLKQKAVPDHEPVTSAD